MSEYQSYEFVALDRPLTADEMAELRAISTRAEITATRFWNEYHWGDLKADPADLLARYFDVHVYFANWGTRRLLLRLPRAAIDVAVLRAYLPGGPATLATTGEHAVVELCSETDEPEDDWYQAEHLCGSLTPLRAELLRGDLRAAYLAWLLAVQDGQVAEETTEPSVPHGIGSPSAPLHALTGFLRLDGDLLAAAAEADPGTGSASDEANRLRTWVEGLPVGEQQRWLLRAAAQPELPLGAELLTAFRRAHPPAATPHRTVGELLGRAAQLRATRRYGAPRRR
jgi:hypothetical protein